MTHLEALLQNHPKPDLVVNSFRWNLRRELLNSARYQSAENINFRLAFFASTAVASMLAVILVMFIVQPQVPGRLHELAFKADAQSSPAKLAGTPGMDSTSTAMNAGIPPANIPGADVDQELVRYWAERLYNARPVNVQPSTAQDLYTVRKYKLDNGQDVLIYTEIPESATMQRVSY